MQEVNSEQLTQATFDYLKKLTSDMEQEFMKREDFMVLTNTIEIASRIHNSGWVLESVLWKEVVAEGTTQMEIRSIQMK